MTKKPIVIQPGFLWDGKEKLSGKLELTAGALTFHFDQFKESNLNLNIPLKEIQEVHLFKLFEVSINGLNIIDKSGHTNLFVMEDPGVIKKEILKRLEEN